MTKGRIVVTETELWRSYWWFAPIMLLLTTEWLLRKRALLVRPAQPQVAGA